MISENSELIWAIAERMQAEIAREIRVLLGEEAYDQRIFTREETRRRIHALKDCAESSRSDAERHESWMAMHRESGWEYGPELLPAEKKHPNLLPWDELPQNTRSKARIFNIVAQYTGKLIAELEEIYA